MGFMYVVVSFGKNPQIPQRTRVDIAGKSQPFIFSLPSLPQRWFTAETHT